MFKFRRGPIKRYPPVGQCIYCGTTEGPLRREHIVPLGLGGERILPEASCIPCARLTGMVEHQCLRRMFGAIRVVADFPTRNRKDRPSKVPVKVVFRDGTPGVIEVSPDEYPPMLWLPVWPGARILRDLPDIPPDARVNDVTLWVFRIKEALTEFTNKHGVLDVSFNEMNGALFSRMLAKIAYAQSVAHFGGLTFDPLVTEFILHGTCNANYLVGCLGSGRA